MHRTHWLILGVGCGVAALYLMVAAWQDIAFVGRRERLVRLGLMIAFAFVAGERFKRATRQ